MVGEAGCERDRRGGTDGGAVVDGFAVGVLSGMAPAGPRSVGGPDDPVKSQKETAGRVDFAF